MTGIIVVGLVAVALQLFLTYRQMLHFSSEFAALRRRGKVAVGRKSGGFHAGAIVMFLVDDQGIIQEGRYMEGVTSLARVRPLPGFEGRDVVGLTRGDGPRRGHRNLGRALEDAANTYRLYTSGETVSQPPSPLMHMTGAVRRLVGRPQVRDGRQ